MLQEVESAPMEPAPFIYIIAHAHNIHTYVNTMYEGDS